MIKSGLLGAVAGGVLAGLLDEKSERGEKSDGGDVRARFGRRKETCVFVEEIGHGFVVALAEEVGFADGLVREWAIEGEGGWREKQGCHE
jgi:hypothetical protein